MFGQSSGVPLGTCLPWGNSQALARVMAVRLRPTQCQLCLLHCLPRWFSKSAPTRPTTMSLWKTSLLRGRMPQERSGRWELLSWPRTLSIRFETSSRQWTLLQTPRRKWYRWVSGTQLCLAIFCLPRKLWTLCMLLLTLKSVTGGLKSP